ncbi:glycosyl hydrolase 115 family protein [Urechidicola croceus]|uniref:Glycosyl hydrolase n=1 Tax=Urechidicola croceus TaxID=1850246 RepID=A0A1D8PBA4_9FLAO|nr:glycosyl hydrolase 115 family protein [Urechidicola croceus]AOW21847.1 glycosyl hydrolase [Urechidicola croceus]
MKQTKLRYVFLFIGIALGFWLYKKVVIDKKETTTLVSSEYGFSLSRNGISTPIYVSDNDYSGVLKIAKIFQEDIERVSDVKPDLITDKVPSNGTAVIVGTIGKSEIIDKLIADDKIDVSSIKGKWETFLIETVTNPIDGVDEALVIVGSDKRGTIYGMFDISSDIGVSPWYFWADVPVKKKENVYIARGSHTKGTPKVKYRGIFINDEAPALSGWAFENFGGFNAKFYDHVFELILRMKGNYLWPSMWGRMFYVNDPQNAVLADEYGVVMGTSHHEPLTRAHAEWQRFGKGEWNYNTNAEGLKKFWKEGMERRGNTESIITVGMRGDGDEAMSEGTATELLETIVNDQRKIIEEVTGKPASETPQIWALYKEVQDYYDKGMKVPDDVILLLCDDNWGNLRKLPELDAEPREGGYGIYYHFDYVGGPRNYKWLNTTQIERTWEQMNLAYEHGADKLWVVNVGDIKPVEFPIEFFLDYAWDPEKWNANNLPDYYTQWAEKNFGSQFAEEIAYLMSKYTKYNARRKPEMLDPSTYSLVNFNEADRVIEEYNELVIRADSLKSELPEEYHDAFYQLVQHPIVACANLNELYVAAAKNKLYAEQGRASTNKYAQKVKDLYLKDSMITKFYHEELAGGKWNHMMAQTHIGYKIWQEPRFNSMPETVEVDLDDSSDFGFVVEGSNVTFPNDSIKVAKLPEFDNINKQKYYINTFNSIKYLIKGDADWIQIEKDEKGEKGRNFISIDWSKISKNKNETTIKVGGIPVEITANKLDNSVKGFVESNGYISISAENFTKKVEPKSFHWKVVKNLGKTGSSVISLPIKEGRVALSENSPKLSYKVHFQNKGKVKIHTYFAPTINYSTREGMYFGLSFDDEKPTQVNYDSDPWIFNYNGKVPSKWGQNVGDHVKIITTELEISEAGNHTLNYYRVDEGLVLQKIIIETGESGIPESYLGPPESAYAE